MEIPNSTISCLRADSRQGSDRPGSPDQLRLPTGKEEEKDDSCPVEAIYCRVCDGAVTGRDQKIAIQESHTHTFFNPSGLVFELGCFNAAPGCHNAGEATSEFTWFAGYVWRFALCRRCQSHLGWFYETGEHSFYGLILAQLRE